MRGKKAWLILHGKQAMNEQVREAIGALRDEGWDIAVRVTYEGGDAARLVKEGLAAGYETLIAGGGDGTLRDVTEALVRADAQASLVLMPLGTANDFSVAAGISAEPAEALALIKREPVRVDVASAGSQIFLNMATGGFGSNVTANTSEDLKKVLGGVAYLLTGLSRFSEVHAARGRFNGPGFEWEGEFLALGVGNGRQAGGGHELCPQALVDDGLLDVCIVPAAGDTIGTIGTLLSTGIRGLQSVAITARVPWLEMHADEGIDLNLDGEPLNTQGLKFSAEPAALLLHLPERSPLLATGNSPDADA